MLDLILANANVITMNPAFPRARSVGIREGKIAWVSADAAMGTNSDPNTEVIDCRGKTIVPGFIDAHCHLVSYAQSLVTLDCSQAASIADLQNLIRKAAQALPPGTWILGGGYNEFSLAENRHATRWDLDTVSPDHPVSLTHRSGHANLLNSLALQLLGVTMETGDPPNGLIDRDLMTGEPTGLLFGFGQQISKFVADVRKQHTEKGMPLAGRALSGLGITSVHDVSVRNDPGRMELYRAWQKRGDLPQRVSMALGWDAFQKMKESGPIVFANDDFARMEGVKIVLHEITGSLTPGQPELDEMVLQIHQAGCRAVIHAIDQAQILAACQAIEHAVNVLPAADHEHRIEHCSECPPSLARRLAAAGITVVTQPAFVYYNGERYIRTVPAEDFAHLYAVSTLISEGVLVAGSSDFPIVPPNPLMGIYAAVTRRAASGEYVLPEESISPMEALSLFTDKAAKAIGMETSVGSIEPGKLADLVVLSDDPTNVPAEAIKDIAAEMTIIHGRVVWERK